MSIRILYNGDIITEQLFIIKTMRRCAIRVFTVWNLIAVIVSTWQQVIAGMLIYMLSL